ncbi:MAG: hypothetical protein COA67_02565 [Lutibacter sp.]|nr:MAG: hypothetical protein COA67_02565 [Lutibacter sp.]
MKVRFLYPIYSLVVLLMLDSCARRGRPTGGEKDLLAPILISAEPDHKSINFNTKKIRINFDEYIKLKDINKQLVISPPMDNQPIITPVGSASKFINIKILDTLKENTTYTFNFGNSVEDNNEGNPLEQFKYVFSTGSYIDYLSVSGTITDAFNKNPDEDVSILLYQVTENYTDSIIYNERPSYVANSLDSIGFELTNLKNGKYLMVALNDANNNYKFDPKIDKIGFLPDFITLPTDTTFNINIFKEELPFKLIRPSEVKKGHLYFGYEGDPKGITIEPLLKQSDSFKSTLVFEKEFDSVSYWYTPIKADSIQFKVSHKSYVDTVTVKLRSKEIDSLLVTNESRGILNLRDTFAISTNIPIHSIDKSKIKIMDKDSVNVTFTTSLDASKMKLKLNFEKKYNNRYKLNLLPSAVEDLFGNINDTLNFNASTKHPDDYGIINFSLTNIENFPVIIQLVDDSYKLIEEVYATENQILKFKYLDPKNYTFRVIYDTNKNGKWDSGNFLKRIKPEKVKYFDKIIEIRANWEEHEDFNLN